jgi:membrane protein YqaA with SNARE-associated domain
MTEQTPLPATAGVESAAQPPLPAGVPAPPALGAREPGGPPAEGSAERRSLIKVVLSMGALALMSALFLFVPIDWERVGNWGYPGVFVVTFVATASFILPIPYLLIVARAGMHLDPVLLAAVAGVAGALGELTGYAIGVSGRDLVAKGKWYDKANHWLVSYGFWCVAFFAFVPNPFFDAIGFAAGVLRYPLWRFTIACYIGKTLKFWMASESHRVVELSCTWFPIACNAVRSLAG